MGYYSYGVAHAIGPHRTSASSPVIVGLYGGLCARPARKKGADDVREMLQ